VFAAWLFLVGLLFGSFLNVVIARVPHGQSIVRPRSRCPKCGRQLTWYENIPLVSWLIQRGKCRGCGNPISIRYPAVELLTGLLFLACLARFDWTLPLASALVLVLVLIPLTFIDLEHWILPFELTLPGIAAGVALAGMQGLDVFITAVIGAAAGFLIFWAMEFIGLWIFKKEALGAGDKYLLALLGAFLGWKPLLGIIFLSSLQGGLIGSILLLVRGRAGPAPSPAPEGSPQEHDTALPLLPSATAHGEETAALERPTPTEPLPSERSPEARPSPGRIETSPEEPPVPAPPEGGHPVAAPEPEPVALPAPLAAQTEVEEDDWEPGPTNIPFGPWLALAGLEILLLGPWLAEVLPAGFAWMLTGSMGE
jgi:leader peptidase (prepilin peptidase)/N-methyltransferase